MNIMNIFRKHKRDDLELDSEFNIPNTEPEPTLNNYNQQYQNPQDSKPTIPGPAFMEHNTPSQNFNSQSLNSNSSNDIMFIRKEIELVNSKLDSIKAMIDTLNQRMHNMERTNYINQEKRW